MTQSLTTPQAPSLLKRTAEELKLRVSSIRKISNADEFKLVCDYIEGIASGFKRVKEDLDPKIAKARIPLQSLYDEKNSIIGDLESAQTMANRLKFDYEQEYERKRLAEERELEAAENTRIQREAKELADKLKAQGDKAGAREVLAEAKVTTATITVPSSIPKPAGMYNRKPTWEYEIIDAEKVNESYLHKVPNEEKIAELVKRLGLGAEQLIGKGSIKITRKIPNTVVRGAK